MNAYEIEQIEKQMKGDFRLPLSYADWEYVARHARQERAQMIGKAFAGFFATAAAKVAGLARLVRRTAAECTDARLRHN